MEQQTRFYLSIYQILAHLITEQIKKETDPIYQKVSKTIPEIEWSTHAPYIYKINKLNIFLRSKDWLITLNFKLIVYIPRTVVVA